MPSDFRELYLRPAESEVEHLSLVLDPAGIVTAMSRGRGGGLAEDGLVGRHLSELFLPNGITAEKPRRILERAFATGSCNENSLSLNLNGSPFTSSLSATSLFDAAGRHTGFAVVLDGNQQRDRLGQDQSYLVESMPGVVYFYDEQGQFLRWNRNFETVSGYSAEEIACMHPLDFFAGNDRQLLESRIALVLDNGEATVEADFVAKDGKKTPYFFTGRRAVFDGRRCLVGVGIDVSERRAAEDNLAKSERKYRELVENANSIILRWNSDGRITLLNEFGLRFFGYTSEEIIGKHVIGTIVPPLESGGRDLEQLMSDICADPRTFEQSINENLLRNGDRVWIAWTNRIVRDAEGELIEILSVGADITQRKLADEARRESEARYRTLFDQAPDGIIIADTESNYLDANASACRMLGYTHDELVGLHASDIVVPEESGQSEPALMQIYTSSNYHREWQFRRKNGTTFAAEVLASELPDGQILAMIRDISERKQAEAEREKRYRAEAADRIKSAFLATMSHELRTPLNSIIGFTGIVLQELAGPVNAEQRKQLEMVQVSARHLLALVNDVLDISKIEAGQFEISHEPFDITQSITTVLALVAPQAESRGITLGMQSVPELGKAIGDSRRFEQILLNLLSNAVKFTDHGEVTLTAETLTDYMREGEELAQPAIQIKIADTGMGIKPEEIGKLFRPFHQIDAGLTRNHDGTGLGLAICHRLVTMMGGEIHANSEWGKGSVFSVTLPLQGPRAQ
jgi:PAS domain S-box-containing protein